MEGKLSHNVHYRGVTRDQLRTYTGQTTNMNTPPIPAHIDII